jgi:hypothetical protein
MPRPFGEGASRIVANSCQSSSAFGLRSVVRQTPLRRTDISKWRTFDVTTQVEVLKPAGITRVWVPTPLTAETPYQKALGNTWKAEGGSVVFQTDPKYAAGILSAAWPAGQKPLLTLTSRFSTKDIAVDLAGAGRAPAERPAELQKYLERLLPTGGIVKGGRRHREGSAHG